LTLILAQRHVLVLDFKTTTGNNLEQTFTVVVYATGLLRYLEYDTLIRESNNLLNFFIPLRAYHSPLLLLVHALDADDLTEPDSLLLLLWLHID
jgi:hypothetical protein